MTCIRNKYSGCVYPLDRIENGMAVCKGRRSRRVRIDLFRDEWEILPDVYESRRKEYDSTRYDSRRDAMLMEYRLKRMERSNEVCPGCGTHYQITDTGLCLKCMTERMAHESIYRGVYA